MTQNEAAIIEKLDRIEKQLEAHAPEGTKETPLERRVRHLEERLDWLIGVYVRVHDGEYPRKLDKRILDRHFAEGRD